MVAPGTGGDSGVVTPAANEVAGEDLASCPEDCAVCGDGVCTSGHEDTGSCYSDCLPCLGQGQGLGCTAQTNCCSSSCTNSANLARRTCKAPTWPAACGNFVVETGENCEPALPAFVIGSTCEKQGFYAGTLKCTADCKFDTSSCGRACRVSAAQCSKNSQCCSNKCRNGACKTA